MQRSIFHRLSSILWVLIVTGVVLLAIYVSVGRTLVSNVGAYRGVILQELNSRVPFTVDALGVSGEWHSFTPVIVLSGLRLSVDGSDDSPLVLSEGRIGIDVLNSLRTRSLQMTRLALDELSLRGRLTEQGRFSIDGFDGGSEIGEWLREFLISVEFVALRRNTLKLTLPGGEIRDLDLSLRLERDGSYRRLEISLNSSKGARIDMLGEGVGSPFEPEVFDGDLYVDITTGDLGAVQDMLANQLPGIWADGALDLELWLSWDNGEPGLLARVEASDLVVKGKDDAWQLPLDRVALEAELRSGGDRWTVFSSDMQVEHDGVLLQLPRLQLDAWGRALRVRAADVSLEPISQLVSGIEALPPKIAGILRELLPRGTLSAVQLSFGDLGKPASDWEVEGRFHDLGVNSWHGAPGVTAGRGYFQVLPAGGTVMLDSQNLSMDFPSLYSEPLFYDDIHGTLHLNWDSELLRLSSDLITAQGDEGTASVLFGLQVPLVHSDIGLEMDLMVGLENSHPIHRAKYVPNVLSKTLRDWLDASIGEGNVEQGGFAWRGALRRGSGALRSVQLAFNLSETSIDYHPQWPPVKMHTGVVLIDDADVSVWANRADLYASRIGHLSAETWLDAQGQIMLAVDASLQGPAENGLAVLNDSPINDLVKGTFQDWSLAGQLEIDLQLQMNLSDKAVPPQVKVDTRWEQVDMGIYPGNLQLRGINGDFSYSSSRGFSSNGLQGLLWDKPFSAAVSQQHIAGAKRYDPARSLTEIAVITRVDMGDVQDWLKLQSLAFATGETAAEVRVQVAPGEAPLLLVETDLLGINLDFPSPWTKAAEQAQSFRLQLPLGVQGAAMELRLAPELAMHLDLRDGGLYSGALAINEEPGALQPGVLRISGNTALVQGDQWMEFINTYFAAGWNAASTGGVTAATATAEDDPLAPGREPAGLDPGKAEPEPGGSGFTIDIADVHTDRLEIWGQTLDDVDFSLRLDQRKWSLQARTDWVQGEYLQVRGQPVAVLGLKRLDLDGLKKLRLEPAEVELQGESRPLELPDMDISIARLHRGESDWGKLNFGLRSNGATLMARDVSGEIAGLRLGQPDAGQLLWRQGADSLSSLQLGIQFDDFGKTLGRFGYEEILETESGRFDLDLQWPGAPQAFSLLQGQGSVSVAIEQGRFLEAPSGASGTLKVVNILNLADIVQRLSLSHMFESGIPFDSVEGEVFLHSGAIEVAGMEVKGPSSFQFSGVADVARRSMDGELVATLPVANNLPWVAAFIASLPVAAGVYVVSKVLQKQVNRLSSAVYSVTGSWDDPQVKFEHIFDSSGARTASAAAAVEAERDPFLALDPNMPLSPVGAPDPQDTTPVRP